MSWKDKFPKDNIYFETSRGILYCGDCLEIMKEFPKNSIDLVLTDPPYNICKDYGLYKDNMKPKDYLKWITIIYSHFYSLLIDKSHLTFTCAQKYIWFFKDMLESCGFVFRHLAIWYNPARKGGSWPGQWVYSYEPIMDFTKGGFKKLNNGNSVGFTDVWVETSPKNIKHPAKRPVSCWTDLVFLLSSDNDLVLDSFIGSGTTAVAAEKLNRRWIGIEINPEYCEIAKQRILKEL